jgi:hypothetical protein
MAGAADRKRAFPRRQRAEIELADRSADTASIDIGRSGCGVTTPKKTRSPLKTPRQFAIHENATAALEATGPATRSPSMRIGAVGCFYIAAEDSPDGLHSLHESMVLIRDLVFPTTEAAAAENAARMKLTLGGPQQFVSSQEGDRITVPYLAMPA